MIGFVYRNRAETIQWQDRFNMMMDTVILESKETTILGDFNIDLLIPKSKWTQASSVYRLEQLVYRAYPHYSIF